jgi:hypothetical protein
MGLPPTVDCQTESFWTNVPVRRSGNRQPKDEHSNRQDEIIKATYFCNNLTRILQPYLVIANRFITIQYYQQ